MSTQGRRGLAGRSAQPVEGGTPLGLDIALLGPPEVLVDGVPLSVDTRKAVALLAYLAVTGRPQARERVAVLLWPDQDDAHSRSALRRTLSALRTGLGGRWVASAGDSVVLGGEDLTLDIEVFRGHVAQCSGHGHPANATCPACLEPLRRAAAAVRGEFLAGFALRDSPEFDDWQRFEAEGLAREIAQALERLVEAAAAAGSTAEAVEQARRLLAMDPLREPVHRRLMTLYAAGGDRSAAVEQYRECVRVLERELGVAPLEATTELYHAIVEGRIEPAAPVAQPAGEPGQPETAAGTGDLPLVGRGDALAAARIALERGIAGGYLLAVEGEAGIGKTRLVHEALAGLPEGTPVVEVRCFQGEAAMAYAPVAGALRGAAAAAPRSWDEVAPRLRHEAARLVPDLPAPGPEPPPLDGPGAQTRFVEGIARTLIGALAGGVLVVDDAQWADPSSVDLFTYLARRLGNERLALVLTWRSEEVGAGNALPQLASAAVRGDEGTLLSLRRLQPDDVRGLVAASRGGPDDDLAARLFAETEGVPFFLREYLRPGASVGVPWGSGAGMPSSVHELLRARIGSVGEAGRQVLAAAAILGRTFSFGLVRETSGRSEEETLAALEACLDRGLLVEADRASGGATNEPRYDFAHEKLRAVVEEDTTLARRRLLHRRAAERLTRGGAATEAGEAAEHYLRAGMEPEAAVWFERAGAASRSLFANREAAGHLLAALALGHPRQAGLHEDVGDLQTLLGDYGQALVHYEAAAASADPADLPRIEHRLGLLHHRRGEFALADEHLAAAQGGMLEPAERARVLADRSLNAHRAGDADRAKLLAADALAEAERSGDRTAVARAHALRGILASSAGLADDARDELRTSLELTDPDDPAARAAALNSLALAEQTAGDRDAALARATEALELSRAVGDRHGEAAIHGNMADILHAAGREEESREHQRSAAALLADIGASAGDWSPEIWKFAEW